MKLDIGCGLVKKNGFIGIDKIIKTRPDIVADVEYGLPVKTNSISHVYCSHLLEHVNNLPSLMEELYRIVKPNGIIEIIVPYYASLGAFMDPTHVRFFTEETFSYFSKSKKEKHFDYDFNCNFEIIKIEFKYLPQFRYLPFKRLIGHLLFNVIIEMNVKLIAIK